MKYPLYLSKDYKFIKILMWAFVAISISLIVMSIITLCDAYTFLNLTLAQAKIYLTTACISTIVLVGILTIHYQVDGEHLRIKLFFFDLLGGRIRYEKILNIVYSNGMMYISYIWKGVDPVIASIMIAPSKFDKMKDELLSKNKNIVFYEDKDEISDSQQ